MHEVAYFVAEKIAPLELVFCVNPCPKLKL